MFLQIGHNHCNASSIEPFGQPRPLTQVRIKSTPEREILMLLSITCPTKISTAFYKNKNHLKRTLFTLE